MTDLLLYHAIPSRGTIVRWMLEEVGEPYEIKILNMEAGEHKQSEYLNVNPMGRVPALRHGDKVVTETAAICTYLADAFPGANLSVPVDSPLRADYYRWLFFGPVSAETALMWAALGDVKTDIDYKPFATVEDVAETLRGAVSGKDFIVGDHFTTADLIIGGTIFWGLELVPVLPKLPELVDYWSKIAERPAWKRTLEGNEKDKLV